MTGCKRWWWMVLGLSLLSVNGAPVPLSQPGGKWTNPRVQPGAVEWHEDFGAACEASKKSGRPVLLFQMLGRLDQEFC